MASIISSLEESTTSAVNCLNNYFRNTEHGHVVEREGAKDSSAKSESPSSVEERGTPSREVFVVGRDQREAVSN